MANRGYRNKIQTSSVIRDVAYIGSKVSWKGSLLLGFASFFIFYFVIPEWVATSLQDQQNNRFYPMLDAVLGKKLHCLKWLGIACGLIGLFFAVRNYYIESNAGRAERALIGFVARLIGRSLD